MNAVRFPLPARHRPWRHDTNNPEATTSEAECHVCVLFAWLDASTAQHDEWETIRQTVNCPTCDGAMEVGEAPTDIRGGWTPDCPDCTDGKIPLARLLAVGAAVFALPDVDGWEPLHLVSNLRAVQP